jgi:hypothetical protein
MPQNSASRVLSWSESQNLRLLGSQRLSASMKLNPFSRLPLSSASTQNLRLAGLVVLPSAMCSYQQGVSSIITVWAAGRAAAD